MKTLEIFLTLILTISQGIYASIVGFFPKNNPLLTVFNVF